MLYEPLVAKSRSQYGVGMVDEESACFAAPCQKPQAERGPDSTSTGAAASVPLPSPRYLPIAIFSPKYVGQRVGQMLIESHSG
jgi:hypothetical protein